MAALKLIVALAAASAGTVALAQPTATPPPAEQPVEDWRSTARQDVLAAYELYVANHPGMHDPLNPGFPDQLKRARDAALVAAERAKDREGFSRTLAVFTAELSDGHAQVYVPARSSGAPARRLWPGFIAAWRGEGMIVHRAGSGFPLPPGSAILSCDGDPVADVVKRRLIGGFRPAEAGHWWYRSPQSFIAIEGYTDDAPNSCRFRTADGEERDIALSWSPAPEEYGTWITSATDGERTPIGLTEPRQGLFLIGMPTFGLDGDEVKAYGALFETLERRRAELKTARAVVIDLRHNNGGSSSWSQKAARALWGKQPFDQRLENHFKDVRIWWRASQGNTAYMSELEELVGKDGNAELAEWVREIGQGMKAALARGDHFFVEGKERDSRIAPDTLAETDFTTPVYVITPGRCASACLDAIDAFKLFPNVRLIGAPTSGDSTYMEVRTADLPSGEGRVIIPNKIWMQRPRGSGEVYRPDIEMVDADWSTAAFLDRIERDLKPAD